MVWQIWLQNEFTVISGEMPITFMPRMVCQWQNKYVVDKHLARLRRDLPKGVYEARQVDYMLI